MGLIKKDFLNAYAIRVFWKKDGLFGKELGFQKNILFYSNEVVKRYY